jgi:lathosterol oxidase
MQQLPNFSFPISFLLLVLSMFVVVIGRYFLIAGLFQLIFYNWFKHKWQHRKLGKKEVDRKQFATEVKWSVVTSLIFSFIAALTIILWQKGYTKVYLQVSDYGWWYLPLSLAMSMLIHETYYYFLHRWMHVPKVFKILHKVHHDSRTTSAWTAFSFHPLEGFLQAIILPVIILIVPMHIYVLLVQLTIMTFSSVINHLEMEVYPTGFQKNFIGKWIIGATHHSLHHKQYKYNFGLYFTFWDKFKKTESPTYEKIIASDKQQTQRV